MAKFIHNDDDVIWIESTDARVFGVVDSSEILDADGLTISEGTTFQIVDTFLSDIEPEQDFDKETTTYQLENGKLVFCNDDAKFIHA